MLVVTNRTLTRQPTYTEADTATAVVRRTTGFQREFDYVAEATTRTMTGDLVTAREYGHTAEGALTRAKAAANARLTGLRNACGFTADGFRDETRNRADFAFGFAT